MPNRDQSLLFRAAIALGFVLVLAGCTPGGQFDPTTIFDNDAFNSKSKLKGQRIPLFPNGVPGATTGVPADLVKGYKPPPDQADADPDAINPPPAALAAQQAPRPEAKPKVAIGRPRQPVKPPKSNPTRIDVGAKGQPPQAPAQQNVQTNWPAPPPTGAASQGGIWPTPPSTAPPQQAAQQSQGIWPAPPPTAPAAAPPPVAQPKAPPPQSGSQSSPTFDSMWPKPPANGGTSQ